MKRKLASLLYLLYVIILISGCSNKQQEIKKIEDKVIEEKHPIREKTKPNVKVYDANGNLLSEIIGMIDGKIDKYMYQYWNTNQLKRRTRYLNNIKHGHSEVYYENGNIYQEEVYKYGKKNGLQKAYYKNGNVQYTANMMNDSFYGFSKTFYSNSNKKSVRNYNRSGKIIYLKTFRIDGKVIKDIRLGSGIENIYCDLGKLCSRVTYFKGMKTKEKKYDKNENIEKE